MSLERKKRRLYFTLRFNLIFLSSSSSSKNIKIIESRCIPDFWGSHHFCLASSLNQFLQRRPNPLYKLPSSLRCLLRKLNKTSISQKFRHKIYFVGCKTEQCKWAEVNQTSNVADKTPRKIISKPGVILKSAGAAITMCSEINTLLTFTGQRRSILLLL